MNTDDVILLDDDEEGWASTGDTDDGDVVRQESGDTNQRDVDGDTAELAAKNAEAPLLAFPMSTLQIIPVSSVVLTQRNPRSQETERHQDKELAASMDVLVPPHLPIPIGVRETESGQYRLIYGARRFAAVLAAEWEMVSAIVYADDLSVEYERLLQYIENNHRQPLHPLDEAAQVHTVLYSAYLACLIPEASELPDGTRVPSGAEQVATILDKEQQLIDTCLELREACFAAGFLPNNPPLQPNEVLEQHGLSMKTPGQRQRLENVLRTPPQFIARIRALPLSNAAIVSMVKGLRGKKDSDGAVIETPEFQFDTLLTALEEDMQKEKPDVQEGDDPRQKSPQKSPPPLITKIQTICNAVKIRKLLIMQAIQEAQGKSLLEQMAGGGDDALSRLIASFFPQSSDPDPFADDNEDEDGDSDRPNGFPPEDQDRDDDESRAGTRAPASVVAFVTTEEAVTAMEQAVLFLENMLPLSPDDIARLTSLVDSIAVFVEEL